ncbi:MULTISPECIES: lasso RiPP family leader peptide-containing protein [unclassified Actinopolyspora]|uniref:lasso RiPP family leader peptide-containing protein n=1 Tax=unclassified Actinopolyspora TaxID=2639451 RepID=UPI0013F5EB9F|nr:MULTISPECIES: lasso RiPP family leader peptide-containing protein [unclassified Actinopolyspora]NHD16104.1 lasso RiPP family leader peptide-containing protein [Actinopolyspora sp. BKK2]NHE74682.1 lasso RiPP family leader peptide-containing protein [Actinopolyspora sp. BKK1]
MREEIVRQEAADVEDGVYDPPRMVEVGSFNDLTRIKTAGNYIDSPYGVWCVGNCG